MSRLLNELDAQTDGELAEEWKRQKVSPEKFAQWLATERKISVSYRTVARWAAQFESAA